MYKEILQIIEKRSTCVRLKVAAILVKDDRIISTGWNGTPSKHKHCSEIFEGKDSEYIKAHHAEFSKNNELHGEQNCIAWAARTGIKTEGSTMFISYSCCTACAKLIIAAGIKKVYYIKEYDREPEGIDLLKSSGIEIKQLD